MKELASYAFLIPLLAVAAICLSEGAANAVPKQKIAMLRDAFPYANAAFVDKLQAVLQSEYAVTVVSADQLTDWLVNDPKSIDLLLLPDARFFPAKAKDAFLAYLEQGGDLMAIGGPAFSKMMAAHEGKWVDREGAKAVQAAAEPAQMLGDFTPGAMTWRHESSEESNKTSATKVSIEPSGDATLGNALHVAIPGVVSWERVYLDNLSDPFAGGNLTVFWAKGDPGTPELSVEWEESDGSRWYSKIDLKPKWQKYVVAADHFKYASDSPTEGARGTHLDEFKPANAVRLGFAQRRGLTTNPEGSQSFWIARVGAATDAFVGVDFAPPVLETLSPDFKSYEVTDAVRLVPYPGQVVFGDEARKINPGVLICPTWRPRGLGALQKNDYRWIPLVNAVTATGEFRGTPVGMVVNVDNSFASSVWGMVGISDPDVLKKYPDYVVNITRGVLNRMDSGVFLQSAGLEHFCYLTGEKVNAGIRAANLGRELMTKVGLTIKQDKNQVYSKTWPASDWADVREELTGFELKPGHYTAESTVSVSDRVVDMISYDFTVADANRKLGEDLVTVKDGDFYLRGKKWYPVGINYWPQCCSGTDPKTFRTTFWEDPGQYDPEWVNLDLDQLVSLGMNSISIQYPNVECARPVMDLLERCRERGIKVNVSANGHPISGKPEKAAGLAAAAHFAENDTVYTYDLAWEPHLGAYAERKELDPRWNRWLEDRYGSVANAEKDWNFSVTENGAATGPTDEQLMKDGPWKTMVAAYRRFADDIISQGYGRSVRVISRVDPNHLFSVRTGYGGTGQMWIAYRMPFDLTSGVKHLDFTSPEGYGLGGDYLNYKRAGFLNLYGRFVGGGRPVFWSEYGVPIYFQGNTWSWSMDGQTSYFRNMHRMFLETDVNGGSGWWWPGGHRVDEDSDFGVINADRTPRPAAIELQKLASAYKAPRERKPADTWIEIDRDVEVSGIAMMWRKHWDEYVKALDEGKTPGLRTKGTGTNSSNVPLVAVGNTPLNGHNPPKYLNAEFNYVQIQDATGKWADVEDGATIDVAAGQPVKARGSVGNTQEATWLTPAEAMNGGGVYLCAGSGETATQKWAIAKTTPYLADADFAEFQMSPVSAGTAITMWMMADNRASFGEKLKFTLRPQ